MSRKVLPSRDAWRAERVKGIGASDAAAILGVSPWGSALSLFFEKRGEQPPNAGQEFARRLGLALEDPIAQLWSGETRRRFIRPDPGTFWQDTHPTRPHMKASIDGEAASSPDDPTMTAVLEIKTAAISKAKIWEAEPPIDYLVQVQHQLACCPEKECAVIVALIGGVSLRYADVQRDPEFISMLEAACDEFWRRVELNDPPPPDGTETTKEFLKRMYPFAEPKSIDLGPDAIEWDQQKEKYSEEISRLTKLKTAAEVNFLHAMGSATQAVLPNGVIYTLKEQTRVAHSVKESKFRVLRRVGPKTAIRRPVTPPNLAARDLRDEFDRAEQLEQAEADLDKPW